MALQEIRRHIKLASRHVLRESAQHHRQAIRNARRQANSLGVHAGENLRGAGKYSRRCSSSRSLRDRQYWPSDRHRDRCDEPRSVQSACRAKADNARMAESSAAAIGLALASSPRSPVDDFAPPLQTDFARKRCVGHIAHACHFRIKSIERVQRTAMLCRREQRRDETVSVGPADQLGAIGERILHASQLSIQWSTIPKTGHRVSEQIMLN